NVRVRKSVGTLAADGPELTTLRRAIKAMQDLPDDDPRSWESQAAIHQNFCPHSNWFFFPWHRAYLLSFERLCGSLAADPGFRLPYWNWTEDTQIPTAFWGDGNPLFNSTRRVSAV